jgi:hypothetical protein
LNYSTVNYLSLPFDLIDSLDLADLTDLTSFRVSLLPSFAISSIAFYISSVKKLLGSDWSRSISFSYKDNFPPSFFISFYNFSI